MKHLTNSRDDGPAALRRPDGSRATATVDKLETARRYQMELGAVSEEKYDDNHRERIEANLERMVEESATRGHEVVDDDIELEEIRLAISTLKCGKTPGVDEISNEMIRRGGDAMLEALAIVFREVWRSETWPAKWAHGLIKAIYKAGSREDCANYRGVTLLSCVGKLLEVVLSRRLWTRSEKENAMSDEQGGFRPNRRVQDQIMILNEITTSRWEKRKPTFLCFIDVAKAYDKVDRPGLWHELWGSGVTGKAWRVLRSMYSGVKRQIVLNGELSKEFTVQLGVAQGAVLSPFLFDVYFDSLAKDVKQAGLGVQVGDEIVGCLLFADDLVLIADSSAQLKAMMDLVSEHSIKWRYKFNNAKCNVVVHGGVRDKREADGTIWSLVGLPVEVAEYYKYLGVEMGRTSVKWKLAVERLTKSAGIQAVRIVAAGARRGGFTAGVARSLWCALVRPILEFSCEIWGTTQGQKAKLESVQNGFIRRVLGLPPSASNALARREIGLQSLEQRRDMLVMRYYQHLCTAGDNRLLGRVFKLRHEQVSAGRPTKSGLQRYQEILSKYGLLEYWEEPSKVSQLGSAEEWGKRVAKAMREHDKQDITKQSLKSATLRRHVRVHPKNKMGAYLNTTSPVSAWVKCRARCDALPLLGRLGRMARPEWSDSAMKCPLCGEESESLEHVLLRCAAYDVARSGMTRRVEEVWAQEGANEGLRRVWESGGDEARICILLGGMEKAPLGGAASVLLERVTRNFLLKVWQERIRRIGGVTQVDSSGRLSIRATNKNGHRLDLSMSKADDSSSAKQRDVPNITVAKCGSRVVGLNAHPFFGMPE